MPRRLFLPLAALLFAAPLLLGAKKKPCKYQQNCDCPVPGITLRWKTTYCLDEQHSNDVNNDEVKRCLSRPEPKELKKMSACQKNAFWKRRICERLHPMSAADMDSCTADKNVPRYVETGETDSAPSGGDLTP